MVKRCRYVKQETFDLQGTLSSTLQKSGTDLELQAAPKHEIDGPHHAKPGPEKIQLQRFFEVSVPRKSHKDVTADKKKNRLYNWRHGYSLLRMSEGRARSMRRTPVAIERTAVAITICCSQFCIFCDFGIQTEQNDCNRLHSGSLALHTPTTHRFSF